jgi:endonuclease YncB( thermonuclease family)
MLCVLAGYIAFGVGTSPPPYPIEDFSKDVAYPVLKVVDGDTVKIDYEGKDTKVRLIGVDTPETVHPNKPVEPFGKEASAFTKNLLLGESVYLRFDGNKTDKYGRMLAYLYRAPDGLFVNLEIVRQGYGYAETQFRSNTWSYSEHTNGGQGKRAKDYGEILKSRHRNQKSWHR